MEGVFVTIGSITSASVVLFCTLCNKWVSGSWLLSWSLKSDLLQCKVLLKKTLLNSIGLSECGV